MGLVQAEGGDSEVFEDEEGTQESMLFRLIKKLGPIPRRITGIVLSLLSGCMYGANFNPPRLSISNSPFFVPPF